MTKKQKEEQEKLKQEFLEKQKNEDKNYYKKIDEDFLSEIRNLEKMELKDKITYNLKLSSVFIKSYTGKTWSELFLDKDFKIKVIKEIENELLNNPKSKKCIANLSFLKKILPLEKENKIMNTPYYSLLLYDRLVMARLEILNHKK